MTQVLQLPVPDTFKETQQLEPQEEVFFPELPSDALSHSQQGAVKKSAEVSPEKSVKRAQMHVPQPEISSAQAPAEAPVALSEMDEIPLFDDFLLGIDPLAWCGVPELPDEDPRFVNPGV